MITGGLAGLARVAPVAGCTTRRYGKRYQWNVKRRVTDILPDPEGPLAVLVAAALLGGWA